MKKLFFLIYFLMFCFLIEPHFTKSPYDLTIVGNVMYRESLARLPISLTELLHKDIKINFIRSPGYYDFKDIDPDIAAILKKHNKTAGNVAILFDDIWNTHKVPADFVPKESFIKIAYSMIEGTAIPPQWVRILNKKFDLCVVPDIFYKKVYKKCGVSIPIFALAHGMELQAFLDEPIKKRNEVFTFGSSGMFIPRKNHSLLVEAFHAEFGNNPAVRLMIHGRSVWEFGCELATMKEAIAGRKPIKCLAPEDAEDNALAPGTNKLSHNITLLHKPLSRKKYKKFLSSLDCYVLLSKGEGLSITPREALALGKPCIISNNTAHTTIVDSGFVYGVPSLIQEPSMQSAMGGYIGFDFNCSIEDVRKALREVYNNYDHYAALAQAGRGWTTQYLWSQRKEKFMNLIKPKKVLLGSDNVVTDTHIMTTSEKLYNKYQTLINSAMELLPVTKNGVNGSIAINSIHKFDSSKTPNLP